jgi:rare lipoprotein A
MRWGRWTALVALFVAGCSLTTSTPPPVRNGRQEGIASWYGPGFHGRRTANGEVYDQYELTAAHPTLPLGTRVMVTSLRNERAVQVRINDRGPFVGGRVIDLSYAAASVIGMIGPGTMPVRVEVLDIPVRVASRRATTPRRARAEAPQREAPAATTVAAPVATPPEPAATAFAVLVATLSDPSKAEHLRSRIALKFPDAHVAPIDVGADRYYRVQIGPYARRPAAVSHAELVNRFGYPAVITESDRP